MAGHQLQDRNARSLRATSGARSRRPATKKPDVGHGGGMPEQALASERKTGKTPAGQNLGRMTFPNPWAFYEREGSGERPPNDAPMLRSRLLFHPWVEKRYMLFPHLQKQKRSPNKCFSVTPCRMTPSRDPRSQRTYKDFR